MALSGPDQAHLEPPPAPPTRGLRAQSQLNRVLISLSHTRHDVAVAASYFFSVPVSWMGPNLCCSFAFGFILCCSE